MIRNVLYLFCVVVLFFSNRAKASDCQSAHTITEIAICSDSGLKSLDDRMEHEYRRIKQEVRPIQFQTIRSLQIKWIELREHSCNGNNYCIERLTTLRLQDLRNIPEQYQLPPPPRMIGIRLTGLRIENVMPNSPAMIAGLKEKDIIISVDKSKVYDDKSFDIAVSNVEANTNSVPIEIMRNGVLYKKDVQLKLPDDMNDDYINYRYFLDLEKNQKTKKTKMAESYSVTPARKYQPVKPEIKFSPPNSPVEQATRWCSENLLECLDGVTKVGESLSKSVVNSPKNANTFRRTFYITIERDSVFNGSAIICDIYINSQKVGELRDGETKDFVFESDFQRTNTIYYKYYEVAGLSKLFGDRKKSSSKATFINNQDMLNFAKFTITKDINISQIYTPEKQKEIRDINLKDKEKKFYNLVQSSDAPAWFKKRIHVSLEGILANGLREVSFVAEAEQSSILMRTIVFITLGHICYMFILWIKEKDPLSIGRYLYAQFRIIFIAYIASFIIKYLFISMICYIVDIEYSIPIEFIFLIEICLITLISIMFYGNIGYNTTTKQPSRLQTYGMRVIFVFLFTSVFNLFEIILKIKEVFSIYNNYCEWLEPFPDALEPKSCNKEKTST